MLPLTNPTATLTQSGSLLGGLVRTVASSAKTLQRSKCQLQQIVKNHWDVSVQRKAAAFLAKENKLTEIATDLENRLEQFKIQIAPHSFDATQKEMLIQLIQEVDLLKEMHFRVAKTNLRFIAEHYQAPVIRLGQMAA